MQLLQLAYCYTGLFTAILDELSIEGERGDLNAPLSSDIEDMLDWFNLGREFAVRSFIDLTSEKMHELWGRRDGL